MLRKTSQALAALVLFVLPGCGAGDQVDKPDQVKPAVADQAEPDPRLHPAFQGQKIDGDPALHPDFQRPKK